MRIRHLFAAGVWVLVLSGLGARSARAEEDDLVARMRRQVECLKETPKDKDCRAIYLQAKTQYLRPRCERANLRGTLRITAGEHEATLANVDRISLGKDDSDNDVMIVQFDMQGSDRLEKMTQGGGELKLEVGSQTLTTRPRSAIGDGRFQIGFGKRATSTIKDEFKNLCKQIETPKLPRSLSLD